MLTVKGFQLALNSDSSENVANALEEFERAILMQHAVVENYGYIGRSSLAALAGLTSIEMLMDPQYPIAIVGILDEYIRSSPDLEELFILWDLPGRDGDKKLSAMHMRCLAAIIFCAHDNEQFCLRIQSRILREHAKSIHGQLTSGNMPLIHSTLGLLLSLCRISDQSCRDIHQKILSVNIPTLSMLSQKGKEIAYVCQGEYKITTDARFFVILLVIRCIRVSDSALLVELLSEKSILRALISTIHKDNLFSIKVLLESLTNVLSSQSMCKLFDRKLQQRVLSLYENTNSDIQATAHKFVVDICLKISTASSSSSRYVFSQLIQLLCPWGDTRHQEVQLLILKQHPSLLSKFIAVIPAPDFGSVFQQACLLEILHQLYTTVDIDNTTKAFVTAICKDEKTDDQIMQFIRLTISEILPAGLTKKDFSKLLNHSNMIIVRLSLEVLSSFLHRIHKIFDEVISNPRFGAYITNMILNSVPEFQLILAVRGRLQKLLKEPQSILLQEKVTDVLHSNLRTIHGFVLAIPHEILRTGFDILRLLDDLFLWELSETIESSSESVLLANDIGIGLTLKIIRQANMHSLIHWFGSREDVVKAITNIIFANSSYEVLKRSAFIKLIVLSKVSTKHAHEARKLLKQVIVQTGMFEGHALASFDLSLQRNIYQESLWLNDNSILIFDFIVRFSYHWNNELCDLMSNISLELVDYAISPVLTACILFSTRSFEIFEEELPTHIRQHIREDSYVAKYDRGFGFDIQALTVHVLTTLATYMKSAENVVRIINHIPNLSKTTKFASAFLDNVQYLENFATRKLAKYTDTKLCISVEGTSNRLSPHVVISCCSNFSDIYLKLDIQLIFIVRVLLNKGIECEPLVLELFRDDLLKKITCIRTGQLNLDDLIRLLIQAINLYSDVLSIFVEKRKSTRKKLTFPLPSYLPDLTSYIIEIFQSLAGALPGLDVLSSSPLHEFICDKTQLGAYCRMIIKTAALSYARRFRINFGKQVSVDTHTRAQNYFNSVAEKIISETNEINEEYFVFLWLFETFLIDSSIIRCALADAVLSHTEILMFFLNARRELEPKNNFARVDLLVIEPVAATVIKNGSLNSLAAAKKDLIESISRKRSFFDGVTISLSDTRAIDFFFAGDLTLDQLIVEAEASSTINEFKILGGHPDLDFQVKIILPCELSKWLHYLYCYVNEYFTDDLQSLSSIVLVTLVELKFGKEDWNFISTFLLPLLEILHGCNFLEISKISLALICLVDIPSNKMRDFLKFALYPLILQLLLGTSILGALSPKISSHVQSAILFYLQELNEMLKDFDRTQSDNVLEEKIYLYFNISLGLLKQSRHVNMPTEAIVKALNKAVKYCLRLGVTSKIALKTVKILLIIYENEENKSLRESDFLNPVYLFRLIIGHSEFKTLMSLKNADLTVFEYLLHLLSFIIHSDLSQKLKSEFLTDEAEQFVKILLFLYRGTTSSSDRTILRILHLLHVEGYSPPLCCLHLKSFRTSDRKMSSSWIFSALSPPEVYSTICAFPFSRPAIPPPFHFEPEQAYSDYRNIVNKFTSHFYGASCDESQYSPDFITDREICSFDPTFWVPALLQALQQENPPIRELANSGLLSIVLACMGSSCCILRTYSAACLHRVCEILESKFAIKDAVFRERPQLLMLLNFLRNSIEPSSSECTNDSVNQFIGAFTSTSCLFFARSGLHLLQSSHELFSRVNKYLLSKPYFDPKDIPLFEATVINGDIQNDTQDILAVLRLVRDGLVRKEDHLNLCRKNAYIHLMIRIPQFLKEVRLAHAAFDIFDRGLSIETAARYLFERCSLVQWISKLASVSAMCLDYDINFRKNNFSEDVPDSGDKIVHEREIVAPAVSRIFSRLLLLLRKSLVANKLLSFASVKSVGHEINHYISTTLDDLIVLDREHFSLFGLDNIRNLIKLLWESSLLSFGTRTIVCGIDKIIRFSDVLVENSLKFANKIDEDYCLLQVLLTTSLISAKEIVSSSLVLFNGINKIQKTVLNILLTIPATTEKSYVFVPTEQKMPNQSSLVNLYRILTLEAASVNNEHSWSHLESFVCDENAGAISSIGTIELIALSVISLLKLYSGICRTELVDVLPTIRFLLLLQKIFSLSNPSLSEFQNLRVILPYLDRYDSSIYDNEFISFQLNLRICLLLSHLALSSNHFVNMEVPDVVLSIQRAFICLLQLPLSSYSSDMGSPMTLREMQTNYSSDGHLLWANKKHRRFYSDLCSYTNHLIAVIVSVIDKSSSVAAGDIEKLLKQASTSLLSKINTLIEKITTSKSESKNSPRDDNQELVSLPDTLIGRFWKVDLPEDVDSPNFRSKKRAIQEIYSIHYLSAVQRNMRSRPYISMKEASQISLRPPSLSTINSKTRTGSSDEEAIDIGDLDLQDLLEFSSHKYPRCAFTPIHNLWSSTAFLGAVRRPSKRKLSAPGR